MDITESNLLRHVTFASGYRLRLADTYKRDRYGKSVLAYEFYVPREVSDSLCLSIIVEETPLFSGSRFSCSPMDAIDSDKCLCALLSFLTIQPGDTDREYFDDYTPAQKAWSESNYCEVLQCDLSSVENPEDSDDPVEAAKFAANFFHNVES